MALQTRTASMAALLIAAGSTASVANAQTWASPVDGNWFDATKWTPQVVPTGAGATAVLGGSGAYTVFTSNNTMGTVNITNSAATLAVDPSNSLSLAGTVQTLNGVLLVNSTGAYAGCNLNLGASAISFSGTGAVRLNSSPSDGNTTSNTAAIFAGGGSLTMGAGTRLEGFGILNSVPSTNNGTYTANVAGRPLRIENQTHQNNGLYTAANTGVLVISSATINQGGSGSMAPGADSAVSLNNTSVNGGSLVSSATGRVQVASGTVNLNSVSVAGGVDQYPSTAAVLGAGGMSFVGGATYTVNVPASYAGTGFYVTAPSTPIGGNGTLRLNASPSDGNTTSNTAMLSRTGSDATASYQFGPGVTLAGFGIVNSVNTTNGGLFNADVNGRYLNLASSTHQNNAAYTATNGGVLLINNSTVNQASGASISAIGAGDSPSAVVLANSSINGGWLVSNGAAHVQQASNASGTLTGVTIQGQFDQNPSSTIFVNAPGITLASGATLLVNSNASYSGTVFRTGDAVTIGGNGTLRLNASTSDGSTTANTACLAEDGGDAGGQFTFAPGVTLAGFGIVNGVPTVNNGVFNADVADRYLRLENSSHQNNAQYRSSGGGVLLVSNTAVTQSPSASTLAGNGSAVVFSSSSVSGGTVGSAAGGNGVTSVNATTVTLSSVTVSRQLTVDPSGNLRAPTTLTLSNNALLTVNTNGSYAGTSFQLPGAPTTIGGTGTVRLNASPSDGSTTANTALMYGDGSVAGNAAVFGPGVTVAGFGRISGVPTTNNGKVSADVSGRILRIDAVTHQNNNRYEAVNGGVLQLVGTTVNQSGPAVTVAGDASSIQLAGATLMGGSLNADGSGRATIIDSSTIGGGLTVNAPLDVNPGTNPTVDPTGITNNNVLTVNANGSYSGTSLSIGGPNTHINGTGEVRLNRSGSDGNATANTGLLRNSGADSSVTFGLGQKLSGSGNSNATITFEGALSPGYPDGAVDFIRNDGTMTFTNTGEMIIDITGPGTFDRIVNAGTIVVDGTIRVHATQDFAAGTTFDIATGGTITGAFDHVLTSGLTSPKRFGARVDAGRIRLTVLCGAADIAGAGADANGDGLLNNNDFIVFINKFFAQDPSVDFGSTGGFQGSDGRFDNNDFIAFIDLFFAGCF
ncbi:MAG: GC-type dockerin domain-anchored protein [Phycisphaerales bacterium]